MGAENKTRKTNASVETYLASIEDGSRRKDCEALAALMRRVTKAPGGMWGGSIVGFGTYHYKYESGREGEMCVVGFASRKGDISVYVPCMSSRREELLARLGKHKAGKGCIYLRRMSDVDATVLEEILRDGVAEARRLYG